MALNASRNGRFEELALPAADAKNLGIIAMKSLARSFSRSAPAKPTSIHCCTIP